jgi:hypothetical protein
VMCLQPITCSMWPCCNIPTTEQQFFAWSSTLVSAGWGLCKDQIMAGMDRVAVPPMKKVALFHVTTESLS